jgi:hypothetical protein
MMQWQTEPCPTCDDYCGDYGQTCAELSREAEDRPDWVGALVVIAVGLPLAVFVARYFHP